MKKLLYNALLLLIWTSQTICFTRHDLNTPLIIKAVQNNNTEALEELIEEGAEIDEVDEHGKTALHYAVLSANTDIVQFLIDQGASIDKQDSSGKTPLSYAKNKKIKRLLTEAGASEE